MRTTIGLSDEVWEKAKIAAVRRRISLEQLIEKALEAYLKD